MALYPTMKLSIRQEGLRHKLSIIVASISVLPVLIASYILCGNKVILEYSHIVVVALTFILIVSGLIVLHQIFERFRMIAKTIKKLGDGGEYLMDIQQKDTAELNQITVGLTGLMKKFEETAAELKHTVSGLTTIRELTGIARKTLDSDGMLDALPEKAVAITKAPIG